MRILLSCASDAERVYLCKALSESLHSVEATDDLRFAHYLAAQERFDALVVCVAGGPSQTDLAAALPTLARLPGRPALVVVLDAASPADCARLLRAGADACFVAPYSVMEITERMRALSRAAPGRAGRGVREVRLDPATRELVEGAQRVELTRREYLVVECLLREANAPIARDYLIRYAWPEKEGVEPSSLNLVVLRLRRKLGACGVRTSIETVSRYGYQLCTG
ncbi:winged helix-turn-helix domain-containing protein [Paraburkholderia sp.]|uniref:response regulator transcription factor n=1 Tax=Paraburkholderia sp. TaxID=1926495 RepID=UPI0025DD9623|nr:winged helix-turn-helix domain-containing protein [Paraburkholderia sp.]